MRKVKVHVDIDVPYDEYRSKALNKKIDKAITKWITDTVKNECSFIPFYVEEADDGSMVECSTGLTKIEVKHVHEDSILFCDSKVCKK